MDSNKQATSLVATRPEAAGLHSALRAAPNYTPTLGNLPNEAAVAIPEFQEDQIISVLCDLFAGRTQHTFGESLEWWAETFQCDLGPKAASGVALVALSKWQFDQRAGADGVAQLRAELLQRACLLITRSVRDTGTAQI
ncbi:hypothetical protein LMG26858_02313 [Achromobacter anxifer]|uniref:Uncharacterized protein n=1 Tax=Achromobacter anxifer TaxID=1287737 RepID=A0A6S7CUE1_9BURK|nr:hypothetical protein [Achromobacter anxifer]CAB3862859.1 hypothetical protein LMG26858_02313 [Achromobacter anxifer]